MRRTAAENGGRLVLGLVTLVVCGLCGCAGPVGTLPRLAELAPSEGYKMLRPDQRVTECGPSALWSNGEEDLLGTAFRRLLQRDDEANVVINARVESTWWSVGVYGRRCVTLTGDLVRTTTTVLLPMPASHGGHGHH